MALRGKPSREHFPGCGRAELGVLMLCFCIIQSTKMADVHPILGNLVESNDALVGKVYTRTVVLWAYGITMDPQELWKNVEVRDVPDGPIITKEEELTAHRETTDRTRNRRTTRTRRPANRNTVPHHHLPVVRMLTTATKRRGRLSKRLRSHQSFRSVLSMDVQYKGFMPNLKISARNTLQVTGAQDLQALGHILKYLVTTYNGRGFTVQPNAQA